MVQSEQLYKAVVPGTNVDINIIITCWWGLYWKLLPAVKTLVSNDLASVVVAEKVVFLKGYISMKDEQDFDDVRFKVISLYIEKRFDSL